MELIECPLKKMKIKDYECYEISMAAEGLAPIVYLSQNKDDIENLRKECLNCLNHKNN